MTPFNIGGLTVREWTDIQSDLHLMEKERKAEERRMRRSRRG